MPPDVPRAFALANADVWTMAAPGDRAQGLLVEGGRLRSVGEERAILRAAHAAGAPVHDLGGRVVLPGLIDSHTHLVHQGLLRQRVDLRDTHSKQAALARVGRAATTHRGRGPLIAERWDESRWRERAWPQRDELDAITTRFPLILRRIDGHVAVANTTAARVLEGRLPGVDVERGLLVEEASLYLNRVWPARVPDSLRAALEAQRLALALGVTTVHDFVIPNYLAAFARLRRRGRLRLRVCASVHAGDLPSARTPVADDRLWLAGVKAFADGSLGGHTAALHRAYADQPGNRGRLNWSDAALGRLVRAAARAGRRPSLHAIGDRAIDQVLNAYETLAPARRVRLRPRLEHFEVHTDEQVERARALGVVVSMQPNFVGEWSRRGGLYHRRFGDDRYRRNNEFRRIRDAGAHLAFGSDCMPFDPWWGLDAVVHAPHAGQRLGLEEALHAYTAGSAYGVGREKELGRLTPGRRADLVVVRRLRAGRPGELARTRVDATLVEGRWVEGRIPRRWPRTRA